MEKIEKFYFTLKIRNYFLAKPIDKYEPYIILIKPILRYERNKILVKMNLYNVN